MAFKRKKGKKENARSEFWVKSRHTSLTGFDLGLLTSLYYVLALGFDDSLNH